MNDFEAMKQDISADNYRFRFLDALQQALFEAGLTTNSHDDRVHVLTKFLPTVVEELMRFEYCIRKQERTGEIDNPRTKVL